MARPLRSACALALAGALVLGLTACAPESPARPTPAASAEPSPERASPSPLPEQTEDPLFTVSARARAVDGTTMDLALVAFEPIPSTDPDAAALVDDFLAACSELDGRSISDPASPISEDTLERYGSSLMRIDYSVTPDDHTLVSPVNVIAGIDNFASVAVGEGVQALQTTDTCLRRYQLTESGEGSFIADYESGASEPDPAQWRFGSYGFTVAFESGATLEACRIEVSPAANAAVSELPGWDTEGGTGISCGIGYTGE